MARKTLFKSDHSSGVYRKEGDWALLREQGQVEFMAKEQGGVRGHKCRGNIRAEGEEQNSGSKDLTGFLGRQVKG